jgi:hypothetical protein
VVELLTAHGADIRSRDARGFPKGLASLLLAATGGHNDLAERLINMLAPDLSLPHGSLQIKRTQNSPGQSRPGGFEVQAVRLACQLIDSAKATP